MTAFVALCRNPLVCVDFTVCGINARPFVQSVGADAPSALQPSITVDGFSATRGITDLGDKISACPLRIFFFYCSICDCVTCHVLSALFRRCC